MNDDAPNLAYDRAYFSPEHVFRPEPSRTRETADTRRAPVYVYTERIILAVNVAIATGRPLLVRGQSGTGKSTLARSVATYLGWRYYEAVITSRTQARELLWDLDLVRRLNDARSGDGRLPADYTPYVVPGVMWWALDRRTAARRGAEPSQPDVEPAPDPQRESDHHRAVVLLDEIDKADPDVPNNLLVPLGSLEFVVEETGALVKGDAAHAPLIVITTNEERELPSAFLRRCVEVRLELPGRDRMLEIARAHFPLPTARRLSEIADALGQMSLSPAEFLDTVRAVEELGVEVGGATWEALAEITAWKHGRRPSR